MPASKMNTQPATILLLALAVASQLPPHSRAQCPPGCFGCQPPPRVTTRVTCTGRGLAAFPLFPVDIQQTVEELWVYLNDQMFGLTIINCRSLRSNVITVITATDLVNFTSLESLWVKIKTTKSYNITPRLLRLSSCRDMSNNRLTTIEPGSFDTTVALSEVYME